MKASFVNRRNPVQFRMVKACVCVCAALIKDRYHSLRREKVDLPPMASKRENGGSLLLIIKKEVLL